MNVIFLDVDGVLNDVNTSKRIKIYIGIDDEKVENLCKIVNSCNATIILISSWKYDWNKSDIQDNVFGQYLVDKLAKFNLTIKDRTYELLVENRGAGIRDYLAKHNVNNWVVLDDEIFDDYTDEILDHLVETSFDDGGLNEIKTVEAINMFKKETERC